MVNRNKKREITMKFLFTLFILFVLVLIGVGCLPPFWKNYQSLLVPFSFRYPALLNLCEKNDLNFEISVFAGKGNCSDNSFDDSYSFSISDTGLSTSETDVKTYLLNSKKEFDLKESENIKKGKLPTTPGFTWLFEEYKGRFLGLENSSVAKIKSIGTASNYIALYKGRVYLIDFLSTTYLNNLLSNQILKTVRFSGN